MTKNNANGPTFCNALVGNLNAVFSAGPKLTKIDGEPRDVGPAGPLLKLFHHFDDPISLTRPLLEKVRT